MDKPANTKQEIPSIPKQEPVKTEDPKEAPPNNEKNIKIVKKKLKKHYEKLIFGLF